MWVIIKTVNFLWQKFVKSTGQLCRIHGNFTGKFALKGNMCHQLKTVKNCFAVALSVLLNFSVNCATMSICLTYHSQYQVTGS